MRGRKLRWESSGSVSTTKGKKRSKAYIGRSKINPSCSPELNCHAPWGVWTWCNSQGSLAERIPPTPGCHSTKFTESMAELKKLTPCWASRNDTQSHTVDMGLKRPLAPTTIRWESFLLKWESSSAVSMAINALSKSCTSKMDALHLPITPWN